jgi:hypothetical protein
MSHESAVEWSLLAVHFVIQRNTLVHYSRVAMCSSWLICLAGLLRDS